MKCFQRITILIAIAALLVGFTVVVKAAPQPSARSFHFVFTADSRDNYTVLPDLSHKMVTLSPVLGAFGGDLCGSFDTSCINNTWKPAMDGNNNDGMLAKTFVVRGNHDNGSLSTWQGLWDFQAMAARIGATNFSAMTSNATYSFDYGNSHFAMVDAPGGSNTWNSPEISWLDSDLTAAEGRGVAHEFLFSHGPMYGVTSEHGGEYPSSALKAVLNKHPISAGFHGHEHITQYTHVTPSVESGINSYQEFTLGRAGAPAYSVSKYTDWHADQNAFADIAISGNSFTVTVYSQSGSSLFTKTFTEGNPAPTSTPKATATPGGGGAYSIVYRSNAAYDGQILESSENSSLGGPVNKTAAIFRLGDDSAKRQFRGILSFNTASLPDNAVITSVRIRIKKAGGSTANPFSSLGNILVDVRTGTFSGKTKLQSADFQALPSKSSMIRIANAASSGWYTAALNPANFSFINKAGNTQFRLRFSTDDNNDSAADFLSFYTGNTTTVANRPALVITYTLP